MAVARLWHPGIVAMLKRHHSAQIEERVRAGDQWQDTGLVFTTELGGPVDPRNLLRVVETAAKSAGIEDIGVHTLRHSAAVAWLESGTHIKAVADLLGHSSIAVTGDVYGHTSLGEARSAVEQLAPGLGCERLRAVRRGAVTFQPSSFIGPRLKSLLLHANSYYADK